MYKIQPVPKDIVNKTRPKTNSVYPFASMKAGDSFFVPDSDSRSKSVASAARAYGVRNNVAFRASKYVRDGVSGVLVYIDDEPVQSPIPFELLEVGKSYLVSFDLATTASVKALCYRRGAELKRKFRTKVEPAGIRVIRVE